MSDQLTIHARWAAAEYCKTNNIAESDKFFELIVNVFIEGYTTGFKSGLTEQYLYEPLGVRGRDNV